MFGRKKKELKRIVDVLYELNNEIILSEVDVNCTEDDYNHLTALSMFWQTYIIVKYGDVVDLDEKGNFVINKKRKH